MGKRSKSSNVAAEEVDVSGKKMKNKRIKFESDETDEPKPSETNVDPSIEQVKRKKKNKSQSNKGDEEKKNKKIIFREDDDEPVEVDVPTTTNQRKRTKEVVPQENEEDIKDEDIDKFCDELNDEDNEQFESWVKLIEAKLHSNKKKPK
ncbi:uncharacterized protein LOC118272033 [Spodoptera frugiperda]|uniref:Uncharacterized protein LOC118272033 n=1 Tax=Spodoptera frugiperda TaxID=7108 RepID=A0A9R0D8D6_SPOFR|nr:uncharacterized protein LOC118272033 [Spodoptera frugiperda]XP_035444224.2 uncharacterized protein LOC118272033 [Spodoptera frugiperda]XP_035444225.2 uncharacterized protein LOC118272033 [Spodoptera frugiperda]XP_035444226.2 uncharacterized protein LOC118272033 [Spodoptera frugiperda]